MTLADWYALSHMVKPHKDPITDRWTYNDKLDYLVGVLLEADAVANGQMQLITQADMDAQMDRITGEYEGAR